MKIKNESLTQEELGLLQAEYEYELETLEEILYVLKEEITSRSPVYEEVLEHVASLVTFYEAKLDAVENLLEKKKEQQKVSKRMLSNKISNIKTT